MNQLITKNQQTLPNSKNPTNPNSMIHESIFIRNKINSTSSLPAKLNDYNSNQHNKEKDNLDSQTETQFDSDNLTSDEWQRDEIPTRRKKRKDTSPIHNDGNKKQKNSPDFVIPTRNSFELLDTEPTNRTNNTDKVYVPKPEPIFVTGVINVNSLKDVLNKFLNSKLYLMTTLRSGHVIKIIPKDIQTYKMIRENFIANNISHCTYQFKSERAYRVVLRGLHALENTTEISKELYEIGHEVRQYQTSRYKGTVACNGQPLKHNSYPKDIKEKIQERRRLRKIWHTTGYPSDKTAFNIYSNELKALISTLENDNIQHYLSNLDPTRDTNYSLWKAIKNLKRPKNHISPINDEKGEWARSNNEKATIFAEYLKTIFQPLPENNPEHTMEIKEYLESANQMYLPLKSTSPKEIVKEIRNLKDDKRCYQVKYGDDLSEVQELKSGVLQGSILGPILYLIFTPDIPTTDYTTTATYADDTALLSAHSNPETASSQQQNHLTEVESWLKHWRIKANESKSIHVTFTLRKETCPPVTLNYKVIPQENNAKYLGMHLNRKLTWKKHIWTKRKQLDGKLRTLNWLLGCKSQLNPNSKMLVYKTNLDLRDTTVGNSQQQ
ncbi:unnamed protein product [Parnassius apollo]|uniref:(apollo) hypothetical protein n=1 Tax=Parnassius apollo TaxID=110799 RepID=A0A8S3WP12_PARAO|nr:unnamed protein product [Parnassius apollo]